MSAAVTGLQPRRFAVTTGATLIFTLAGCSHGGTSTQETSSAARIDPCSVLAPGDMQMALGSAPAAAGKRENMGLVDRCTWSLPNGADVNVTFFNPVGAGTLYAPQLSPRRPRDKAYDAVSGLGDHAVYRDESFPPAIAVSESVEVVKGRQHFEVHYVDAAANAHAPSKESLVTLARTVAMHVT